MQSAGSHAARRRATFVFVLTSVSSAIAAALAERSPGIVGPLLVGSTIVALASWAAVGLLTGPERQSEGRGARLALAGLAMVQICFCLIFAKLGHTVLAIVDSSQLELGLSRPSLVLLSVAPLIVMTPMVSGIWAALGRVGLEPSTAAKFSLGLVMLALSWLCLGVGIEWSGGRAVGLPSLGACAAMLICAAACLGPASLTAIDELGAEQRRPWLALWTLAQLFAYVGMGVPEPRSQALVELFEPVVVMGTACVAGAVLLAFAWRPISALAKPPRRREHDDRYDHDHDLGAMTPMATTRIRA